MPSRLPLLLNRYLHLYLHLYHRRFDRNTGGLGGLSFDEGQFSVFGYVTSSEEVLRQLQSGDRVVSAKLVSGQDRLVTAKDERTD